MNNSLINLSRGFCTHWCDVCELSKNLFSENCDKNAKTELFLLEWMTEFLKNSFGILPGIPGNACLDFKAGPVMNG